MAWSARVFGIGGVMVWFFTLAGCGGMPIHLGIPRDGGDDSRGGTGDLLDGTGNSPDAVSFTLDGAGSSRDGGGDSRDGGCSHGQTNADDVLWIGDSWILVPGVQHTRVRDMARATSAIGPGDDYTIGAVAATTMADIANQYSAQQATANKVKVLIMDGGTWDTIGSNGASATVTSVVNTFKQFLANVASDGTVEHIIYFLPPELSNIPGVAALRPPMLQACAQSTVACHFLDLQPIWAGHPEYTASASGGILPSESGASVLADEIWKLMQQNCIAQ